MDKSIPVHGTILLMIFHAKFQILWKFKFVLIPCLSLRLLQMFSYGTRTVLLCHMQNIVVTTLLEFRGEKNKIYAKFEIVIQKWYWNVPWGNSWLIWLPRWVALTEKCSKPKSRIEISWFIICCVTFSITKQLCLFVFQNVFSDVVHNECCNISAWN